MPTRPRIWFDVQDLLDYVSIARRPSGIQRVCLEIYAALNEMAPERIGFVAHDSIGGGMRCLEWQEVIAHCAPLSSPDEAAPSERDMPPAIPTAPRRGTLRRAARWLAWRLPPELRHALGDTAQAQWSALRALGRAGAAMHGQWRSPVTATGAGARTDLRQVARPGDVVAAFGSPWAHPDYVALLNRAARPAGLRFAMLVHDMIAFQRPEYVDFGNGLLFRQYMERCLPEADLLLAMSGSSARDVKAWVGRKAVQLRAEPRVIPVGIGFASPPPTPLPPGLEPGGYALFVSTLEVRKNHLLVFRAWRELLEQLPKAKVPQLVFAGGAGWGTADLMQMIRNSGQLGGKLTLIDKPDDATLAALYRGARFTLFPSLYEGWGLPVTESLGFGKACLASNSSSVPEAGGAFCLYHDPDSVTEAVALYRRVIEDPAIVEALEAEIATRYRPLPWSETARAVLDALE